MKTSLSAEETLRVYRSVLRLQSPQGGIFQIILCFEMVYFLPGEDI